MDLVQLQWQQFIVLFIINISLELCTQVWQINKYSSTPTNYNTLILQLTQKLQLFPATKPSCKYSSSCNYSEVATFYCQRMCCNQWVYCCISKKENVKITIFCTSTKKPHSTISEETNWDIFTPIFLFFDIISHLIY